MRTPKSNLLKSNGVVALPSEAAQNTEVAWVPEVRRSLLGWFQAHARDLPWRQTADPYAIWVSEIMLQQTQVSTVVPYYQRFLRAFPNVTALAESDEREVLQLWEGLGYYRRARQMHAAARVVVERHGGNFPDDPAAIQSLPGIGRYTAGAVASIAFDIAAPILEANTIRLWSRLAGIRGDVARQETLRQLWRLAELVHGLDHVGRQAGRVNQALMEVGSQICLPQGPLCRTCPLAGCCAANRGGLQSTIPYSSRKVQYEEVREVVLLVRRSDAVLVRQCQSGERWAGLWDFPRFRIGPLDQPTKTLDLVKSCETLTGVRPRIGRLLTTIQHGVTRFRITLECYEAVVSRGQRPGVHSSWIEASEISSVPLNVTARKLAKQFIG